MFRHDNVHSSSPTTVLTAPTLLLIKVTRIHTIVSTQIGAWLLKAQPDACAFAPIDHGAKGDVHCRALAHPVLSSWRSSKRWQDRVAAVLLLGQGHLGSTYNMRMATSSNCQHQACCERMPTGAGNGTSVPKSRMTCCFYTIKVDLKQQEH